MICYEDYNLHLFSMNILSSLKKKVLMEKLIPWQEICLAIECFLKICEELPKMSEMDDNHSSYFLIDYYHNSEENDLVDVFNQNNYYTIPSFDYLIKHLCKLGILHDCILDIIDNINIKKQQVDWQTMRGDIWLSKHNVFLPEEIIIRRDETGIFSSIGEYNYAFDNCVEFPFLGLYADTYPSTQQKVVHNDVACIWPFSDGYARVIGKNGRWGYLSQEDNKIRWIDINISYVYDLDGNVTGIDLSDSVLYADDFKCERARIQLDDEKKSYMYLGLCLENCFEKTFRKASEFNDGFAMVSDEYCDNYTINVFGEIINEDKKRYEECKSVNERKEHTRVGRRIGYYDPETEIMNSLTGHGADPEIYGF